jgi:hypothetical protein
MALSIAVSSAVSDSVGERRFIDASVTDALRTVPSF